MQSSDFLKLQHNATVVEGYKTRKSATSVVLVEGEEYFKKQLLGDYKNTLRYRMALYKEFNVGNQIECPYIVKYKSINEDENGIYVLMEHVNGMNIAEKMKAEPDYFRNLHNVIRLLRQVLIALKELHSRNIAYIDLKPENIMLTQISNDVKLIDLGGCFADCNSFTAERTNEYAAPELNKNSMSEVDARTDIYGVGRLLQYIEEKADIKLPKYLKRIKQRCLNEEKSQRYESADALLDTLNRRRRITISTAGCMLLILACVLGWQEYSQTEHYRRTALLLKSDALIEGIYYEKFAGDSAICRVMGWKDKINLYIRDKIILNDKEYVVTEIADKVFYKRDNIESAFFPKSLRKIGAQAFYGCKKLKTVTLPEGLTELGFACFKETGIHNVSLPSSLKSIGHASFAACHNLTEIEIPEGVESLELDAFACCHKLTDVKLPASLSSISRGVFWDCPSLEEISIPAKVSSIGEYAFFHCTKLKHVYNYATEPQPVSTIFNRNDIIIHVPAASAEKYRNAYHWRNMIIVGDLTAR